MERKHVQAGSSPMQGVAASSSTATASTLLRLVDCPRCGVRLVRIRSKQRETYGEVFYKCPNNIKEDPRTCKFIRSEEQYERYVRGLDAIEGLQATGQVHWLGEAGNAEMATLKQELDLVKQQLHVAAMDIANLKMQRIENKVLGFGMDTSVAVALCVGVVIGMLVNAM